MYYCMYIASLSHTLTRSSATADAPRDAPSIEIASIAAQLGWLGSRVVSVLDSGAEGLGFKWQSRHCRVTVLGKLFTPIVPLFVKQQKW